MKRALSSCSKKMVISEGIQATERLERLEGNAHYLLPEVPNDITLDQIAPKLSWRDFYILLSVSVAWHNAIRSRRVYNARVRSLSTETLVLLNYTRTETTNELALFSMRDSSCYKLPPVPYLCRGGIPRWCQFLPLDGKIYGMGGESESNSVSCTNKIYVLDVAGQGQWKQCASMNEPKGDFGSGVINGKIYVFRISFDYSLLGSEVYDPKKDTWSLIRPMTSWRPGQRAVVTVGQKILLHHRKACRSDYLECVKILQWWKSGDSGDPEDRLQCAESSADCVSARDECGLPFMAQGKFYSMGFRDIPKYDVVHESWTCLHSFTLATIAAEDSLFIIPRVVLAIDDELLALVFSSDRDSQIQAPYLVQSRGLGSECKETVWERAQCSLPFLGLPHKFGYSMDPIKL